MSYGVGLSLRSARTVLENAKLTAVSTAVSTVVSTLVQAVIPTGTITVIVPGQRPDSQGTG